ncbi:hypothetical protein [Archangium sp.]|uniref:hypothetical protein n=1 Tax=Archangium sp. TaxID=1872627 RepID=UPI00286A389D|nr:hypothetical protein [Archangium sp.]
MDEEKKSKASGEPPDRLGPFLIQQEVGRSAPGQEEVYLATHETSGAAALLIKLTAKQAAALKKSWRVFIGYWAEEGFFSLQAEHTPWSRAQDRQSVESLLFTFAAVLDGVRRMGRAVPDIREPRPRWHLGLALAGAVAIGALLFTLVRPALVSKPPNCPEPMASAAPAPVSTEVLTTTERPDPLVRSWSVDTMPQGQSVFALPFPRERFKGQKRPPCTPYVQVELVGGCWVPHKLKAPCPGDLYEHQGECYLPVLATKPPPQSVGQ